MQTLFPKQNSKYFEVSEVLRTQDSDHPTGANVAANLDASVAGSSSIPLSPEARLLVDEYKAFETSFRQEAVINVDPNSSVGRQSLWEKKVGWSKLLEGKW